MCSGILFPSARKLIDEGWIGSIDNALVVQSAGDGNHWAAEVVDESFRGMNRVQQQRAVYASLKGKMDGPNGDLHALALTTKAPD